MYIARYGVYCSRCIDVFDIYFFNYVGGGFFFFLSLALLSFSPSARRRPLRSTATPAPTTKANAAKTAVKTAASTATQQGQPECNRTIDAS